VVHALRPARILTALALPAVLLVAWQLAGPALSTDRPIPVPTGVLAAAGDMIRRGDLQTAMGTSLLRVLGGFGMGAGVAVLIGLAMGYFRGVERNLDPLVQTFRMVAAIALVPLAIIWFGPRGQAAIFIVAYGAFFPVVINTIAAVHGVEPVLVRAARTMGISPPSIVRHVILPGTLPTLFVGLRLGLGTAWGAILAAELTVSATAQITNSGAGLESSVAASGGIGFLMFYLYDNRVDLSQIVVCMVTVGLVAYLLDRALRFAQVRLIPWAPHAR
jgi:ABC-type nitrate/sulfonate/bicarbonate transport system permease component